MSFVVVVFSSATNKSFGWSGVECQTQQCFGCPISVGSTLCLFSMGRTLVGVSKCWPAQELLFKREMRDLGDGTVSKGLGVHRKSQGQW